MLIDSQLVDNKYRVIFHENTKTNHAVYLNTVYSGTSYINIIHSSRIKTVLHFDIKKSVLQISKEHAREVWKVLIEEYDFKPLISISDYIDEINDVELAELLKE